MIFINLLPPDKKAIIKRDLIFTMLISTLEFFVILAILISSVLIAGKQVLENNFETAIGQNALITKNFGLINREIRLYNNQFADADKLLGQSIDWSHFLLDISRLMGPNITLQNLTLNPENKKMTLSGFAVHRNDLLDFIDQLNKNENVSHTESPLSNLFSRNNIIFEINSDFNIKQIEKNYSKRL